MMVELKNGETFNGHLTACDNWMNLTLREALQTSASGERFWKLPECYIRGNTIKYLRVEEEIIDLVKEDANRFRQARGGRGVGGDRGRGGNRGGRGGGDRGGRGGQRGGFRGRGRGQ